jgi:hypothetical protein
VRNSPWPFADPPNCAAFTVKPILERAAPILLVSHDVADGGWQFLTGGDLGEVSPMIVCLEDVIALDPALEALADLRLGWTAQRDRVGMDWEREPSFPTDWNELVRRACEVTTERQDRMKTTFRVGDWERFDLDQETASFTWSSKGQVAVVADMRVVGSTSKQSGTWLWAWANGTILEGACTGVANLAVFGEQHGFEKLSQPKWPGDEIDAWEMANIACLLLDCDGVYRAPHERGVMFLALDNIRWAV